ncbi:hypothetical protein GCM10011348_14310 [Marinobacterium nitratireducens]|uniref:Uncharacterized protein n=1 Tax=Marinobacterium nitratireducens TaxID=518897 RepID=A0A917ZAS2_9GAMM|nr:hypothetical protein [Marinobacterium nitratireducens]GGO79609.1 hypothetical protein GCM10011348_14310 [Marinobacterium nitratireducens]
MSAKLLTRQLPRGLALLALIAGLLGCGATATQPTADAATSPKDSGPACYVSGESLAHLLRLEHRYLLADSDEQRMRQLMEARQSRDKALEALLLISPASSAEDSRLGAELLGSLPLYPDDKCIADRYLFLHLSQVRHDLARSDELKAREDEITELKRKIEALTDLEQQITRQRKDL